MMVISIGRKLPLPEDPFLTDDDTLVSINTEKGFPTNGTSGVVFYQPQGQIDILSAGKKLFGKKGRAGFAQSAVFWLRQDGTEFLVRNSGDPEYRIIQVSNGKFRSIPVSKIKDAVNSGILDSRYAEPAWRDRIGWTKVR